ncbi:MAG: Cna B-type domain-containing protein [Firmicutes bacterium]|nr:Cna B-type domain-containing protein [Bacillota bacterium]
MRRKFWALLMTIMMIATMVPASAFATEEQTATQIGNYYEVDDGTGDLPAKPELISEKTEDTEQSYEGGKVKVNKTISPTEEENVFDVNLTVKTTKKIETTEITADAAAVLVIDCSGSMDGGSIRSAKKAAQTFINNFVAANTERKVAIVKFSGSQYSDISGATTIQSWIKASDVKTTSDDIYCPAIKGLNAGGGTNIEAGLILAKNLLSDDSVKNIANKNVILLTDGKPTFGVGSSEKNSTSKEFICHNGSNMTGNGSDTSCQTHKGAEDVAKSIKASGVSTYAIYLGEQDVYCSNRCGLNTTGAKWLADDCGFTAYSTKNASQLVNIFNTIIQIIEKKARAWILTDPMGSGIDFVKFNQEANPVNEFEYKNGKITWNIKNGSVPEENTDEKTGITTYTYSLSYQIKLDTLAEGFKTGTWYNTNEPTKLTYLIITKDSTTGEGEETYKEGNAYCNIPSVGGFAGNLSFNKTGSFGEALAGATFKLTHTTKDGTVDWSMTATSDKDGIVRFENIPSGHEYTLAETSAPDKYTGTDAKYTVTVSYGKVTVKDADGKIVDPPSLTVKNESKKTSISVTKKWEDNGNQDGIRPDSVTVQLTADGDKVEGKTAELSEDNDWLVTFDDLPKYKGGVKVEYSVAEVEVPEGYTSASAVDKETGAVTITNSHTPAVKDVTVKKEWKDNNNQDGLRTEKIEVQLTANGDKVEGKTAELSEANNWTVTFENLPVKANGEAIAYSAVEANVPEGYTSASEVDKKTGAVTITNSHTPAVKDVTVKKEWKDNNNQDGLRTEKIEVQLTADGKTVEGKTAELSETNNWTVTFDKLPVKANGEAIAYSAVEVNVPEGYTSASEVDKKTGAVTITNSHAPATTSVSVTKAWVDGDNEDGVRPDSVTVQLKANGEAEGDAVTLNADNQWTYTWEDLAAKSAGKNIAYTVEETNVPAGYEPEVTGTAKDGFTITNTIKQDTVTIEGTKTWIDPEGTVHPEITINLLRNGEVYKSVKLANGETSYKFEGLDKYDEKGFKYAYKVVEVEKDVPGYTATYEGNNVVNTIKQEEISVSGTKTWIDPEGTAHPEITIKLLRDGEPYGDPITLKNGETDYRFYNLPKYDLTDGHIYKYTVDEVSVEGYTSDVDGYNITNTIKQDYVSVAGTKTWRDPEGTAHPAITINLLQDGTEIDEVVLQNGTTTYEFTNLEKYDLEDGHEYIYTVTEDSVEGYISVKDNNNFTNTIEPGQTTISGVKTWIAPQGTEFPTVKIVLLQNGNELDSVELTNGNTEYSFDVPVYDSDGQKYEYAIAEADVAGYTSVVDGYNVTNTIEQKKIDITGTKEWNAPEGTEYPDVTIDLLRDGEVVDSTVIKSGESEYSFTDLDKYDLSDGHVYDYNIQEEDTEGYSAEYDGYDIVNTINQNYVSVSGTKSWVAPEGTEFPDITINLLKNGEEIDEVVLQNGQTDFTFDGLEEYSYEEDGTVTVNEYTVTEDEVEGYTSSIDGYNITNEKDAEPVIPDDKPKTGDNFSIMLFAGTALAALLAALAIIFTRRRRNA